MAYIDQDTKKQIADALKEALKGKNLKWTLSIQHHSNLTCTISAGPAFLAVEGKDYYNVNQYHIANQHNAEAAELLTLIQKCLDLKNYDNSDTQRDYFDVGYYTSLRVGRFGKPFEVI